MKPARGRPSAALIVAVVALVLACAGSATAARLITGRQIKDSSITTKDVKNGSLLKRDFGAAQLPRGPQGTRGAEGPAGPRGPAGGAGRNGSNGFGVLRYPSNGFVLSNGQSDFVQVPCPAGTYPTGGDAWAVDQATQLTFHPEVITGQGFTSTAAGVGTGWFANVDDVSSGDVDVFVDAICANASQVGAARTGARRKRR